MTQAAHIRHGVSGIAIKPCDSLCIPLSYIMHDRQHRMGSEERFYKDFGGVEKAMILIARFRA